MAISQCFSKYLKPQGRQILLKCRLTDTLHPNKNCLKIYQGHVSSAVDATDMMFTSIQSNEMSQLTWAAIIHCEQQSTHRDRCLAREGKGSGHFGRNRIALLEPSRGKIWKGEKKTQRVSKYCGYYYLDILDQCQEVPEDRGFVARYILANNKMK